MLCRQLALCWVAAARGRSWISLAGSLKRGFTIQRVCIKVILGIQNVKRWEGVEASASAGGRQNGCVSDSERLRAAYSKLVESLEVFTARSLQKRSSSESGVKRMASVLMCGAAAYNWKEKMPFSQESYSRVAGSCMFFGRGFKGLPRMQTIQQWAVMSSFQA